MERKRTIFGPKNYWENFNSKLELQIIRTYSYNAVANEKCLEIIVAYLN
jgi:hypothetical protein